MAIDMKNDTVPELVNLQSIYGTDIKILRGENEE